MTGSEAKAEGASGRAPGGPVAGPAPGRHGKSWPALAAAVRVVALAAAAAVALTGGDRSDPAAVSGAPPGWLLPTWLPERTTVWGVEASGGADEAAGTEQDWSIVQLFGDPDDGRAIYVQASGGSRQGPPGGARPVTVRGTSGWAAPRADTGEIVDTVVWDERGATVTALYKGLTGAEAIAALDALTWRSDPPAGGFDPPGDGTLPLRGENIEPGRDTNTVRLLVSEGVPASAPGRGRPGLSVHAAVGDSLPLGYLDHWFHEEEGGDGPVRSFDAATGELRVDWPDGRELYLSPLGGDPRAVDEATLDRMADGVARGTAADLDDLRDRAATAAAGLPVLAAAATGAGTLEVRGEGGFAVLCLRTPSGESADCRGAAGLSFAATGSWLVGGTWYVGAASSAGTPAIFGDRAASVTGDTLPVESAVDGPWNLVLATVPPGVDDVSLSVDGDPGILTGLPRPG
jgi:hypothetical protein